MRKLIPSLIFALACSSPVLAADCAKDHLDDYESGVTAGRQDGSRGVSEDPTRHRKPDGEHKNRWTCYADGYSVGYGNASADRQREAGHNKHGNDRGSAGGHAADVPRQGSNERAYYDDGCQRGREDGKAGMSSYYGRHENDYDSRFEPYFAQGYEKCWRESR